MQNFTTKTPDKVRDALSLSKSSKDHFFIFDSLSDLAENFDSVSSGASRSRSFAGGMDRYEAVEACRSGAPDLVAQSDKFLEQFESMTFATTGRAWADDVTGVIPNVPAFLAGVPCNMRRRIRLEDSGRPPIAIIADVVASAACEAGEMARRGAAILALVRALSAKRPVELWAMGGLDATNGAVYIAARIDTTPLDLSLAAFALCHAAFSRQLCFGIGESVGYGGSWPYRKGGNHRAYMSEIIKPAFDHVAETLCIEPMHINDIISKNPEKWISEQIERLSPVSLAA